MDDTLLPARPAQDRPLSRRVVLWDELEQLHARLLMESPTQTFTLEALETEVERLRQILAELQRTAK